MIQFLLTQISKLKSMINSESEKIPKYICGSKTVTVSANAEGYETVEVPWSTSDYSVSISNKYAPNFTNAHLCFKEKNSSSVKIGFYNSHSASITMDIDYIIIKNP